MIRNFINIEGITPETELPRQVTGQVITYSELDYIFVPDDKSKIKNIFEIIVDVQIKDTKIMNCNDDKIVIVDGIKKLKIIYSEENTNDKARILELENPYNTFFELSNGDVIEQISVYIIDAYFKLLDNNKIYSNLVYMVDVCYDEGEHSKNNVYKVDNKSFIDDEKEINVIKTDEFEESAWKENTYFIEEKSNIALEEISTLIEDSDECNYKYDLLDVDSEYL